MTPKQKVPVFPFTAHGGHPRIPAALEAKARAMVLRGDGTPTIIKTLKIGGATLTRIRRQIQSEADETRRALMVKILNACLKGGMARAEATALLEEVTGLRLI